MNTEIENIISNHDFAELTADQKVLVNEWASSEEEYVTMKQIMASAPLLDANVGPSSKLKASLMDTFATTYSASAATVASGGANVQRKGKEKKVIFIWLRAGAAVAAVILAVFLIYPMFNSSSELNMVAENKVIEKKDKDPKGKLEKTKSKTNLNKDEAIKTEPHSELGDEIPRSIRNLQVAPTTGPENGLARSSEIEAIEMEVMDIDADVPVAVASPAFTFSNNQPVPATSNLSGFNGYTSSGSVEDASFGEVISEEHPDRLAKADLPEHRRPIIQEQPELLNLLHTTF